MKRKFWLAVLLFVPLALAIPLWFAASWRPQFLGAHPFTSNARAAKAMASVPIERFDLMIAPDGARLLSISEAGAVGPARGLAMWNVKSERVMWKKTQDGVLDWVPLCFSPDGQTLAMAHNPGPHCCISYVGPGLALFDAQTGVQTAAFPFNQPAYRFHAAVFSRDGKTLMTATEKGVQKWDVGAKRLLSDRNTSSLVGVRNLGSGPDVAFSRNGQRVVFNWGNWRSTKKGSQIHSAMRDMATEAQWKVPIAAPVYATFSPDGRWLLLGNRHTAQLEVREAENGRLVWRKSFGLAPPQRGGWMSDENAVVADDGQKFRIIDAQTGKLLRILPHRALQNFVVSPDGNRLYSISSQGQITRQRLK